MSFAPPFEVTIRGTHDVPSDGVLTTELDYLGKMVRLRVYPTSGVKSIYYGELAFPGRTVRVAVNTSYDSFPWEYGSNGRLRDLTPLQTARHERVVPIYGMCTLPGSLGGRLALVMPFMANGILAGYLRRNPTADRRTLIKQVAEGLAYLHDELGLIHGVLNQSSIFVSAAGSAAVGVFAFDGALDTPDQSTILPLPPFIPYVAPEILMSDNTCYPGYVQPRTRASDIYAYGMLIYEMMTGQNPWHGGLNMSVIEQLTSGGLASFAKDEIFEEPFWGVFSACTAFDPCDRPSANDIVTWLSSSEVSPTNEEYADENCAPERGTSDTSERALRSGSYVGARYRECDPPTIPEKLSAKISGMEVDIKLQNQRALFRASGVEVYKGQAKIFGASRCLAVKICRGTKIGYHERDIWRSLDHENVLKLYGILDFPAGDGFASMATCIFISPFMERGNLIQYLGLNPLADRLRLMADVANGLSYLHNIKSVVHGDIKSENVLVSDQGRALLADFGLSTTVLPGPQETDEHIRRLFSWVYCAPEIFYDSACDPSTPSRTRSKTRMTDMYAYGVLLYHTYAMDRLGHSRGERIVLTGAMHAGILPPRPSDGSGQSVFRDELWSICKRCWATDARCRPDISTVLAELRILSATGQVLACFERQLSTHLLDEQLAISGCELDCGKKAEHACAPGVLVIMMMLLVILDFF